MLGCFTLTFLKENDETCLNSLADATSSCESSEAGWHMCERGASNN